MVLSGISQNSQENTCARVSFLINFDTSNFINKKTEVFSCDMCFPVNFVKFLRTPSYIEHLWWLILKKRTLFSQYDQFEKVEAFLP